MKSPLHRIAREPHKQEGHHQLQYHHVAGMLISLWFAFCQCVSDSSGCCRGRVQHQTGWVPSLMRRSAC